MGFVADLWQKTQVGPQSLRPEVPSPPASVHNTMTWRFTVTGNRSELEALVGNSGAPGCNFERGDDGSCVLMSDQFKQLPGPWEVEAEARRLLGVANRSLMLSFPGVSPVRLGGITYAEEDGSVSAHVLPRMVMIPIRFPGSTPSTDDEPPSGTPQIRRSLDLGAENPNVSEARGIFGSDRSWFGLYKISEIVWHDVGTRIVGKGWTTGTEVQRFPDTANHESTGPDARHARSRKDHPSPSDPMPHDEAVKLIEGVLLHWIADKSRPA